MLPDGFSKGKSMDVSGAMLGHYLNIMEYIFLDTNIFLHCQAIDNIDWLSEISSDSCKLIISPIVIDELDKIKTGTDNQSNKARKALLMIEEKSENNKPQIRESVYLEIIDKKPLKSFYDQNDLNFDEYDQRLIASILQYRVEKKIDRIYLCTNDVGLRIRAKRFNIINLKLSEGYQIQPKVTEEEKKIKKLEREILLLKSSIPKIDLVFEKSKKKIEFIIDFQVDPLSDEGSKKIMTEIKSTHTYLKPEEENPYDNPISKITKSIFALSEEQINDYNSRLDKFYEDYEHWIWENSLYNERKRLTFSLKLYLRNDGKAPANDIDIHLHFPDGFELFETIELPVAPTAPSPPHKPNSNLDFGSLNMPHFNYSHPIIPNSNLRLTRPNIKKSDSYEVDFDVPGLKHGYIHELESLSIVFLSKSEIRNFHIDYILSAANIPEQSKGKLHVTFNR
jgi:rRNA-processing protein FCF1